MLKLQKHHDLMIQFYQFPSYTGTREVSQSWGCVQRLAAEYCGAEGEGAASGASQFFRLICEAH